MYHVLNYSQFESNPSTYSKIIKHNIVNVAIAVALSEGDGKEQFI